MTTLTQEQQRGLAKLVTLGKRFELAVDALVGWRGWLEQRADKAIDAQRLPAQRLLEASDELQAIKADLIEGIKSVEGASKGWREELREAHARCEALAKGCDTQRDRADQWYHAAVAAWDEQERLTRERDHLRECMEGIAIALDETRTDGLYDAALRIKRQRDKAIKERDTAVELLEDERNITRRLREDHDIEEERERTEAAREERDQARQHFYDAAKERDELQAQLNGLISDASPEIYAIASGQMERQMQELKAEVGGLELYGELHREHEEMKAELKGEIAKSSRLQRELKALRRFQEEDAQVIAAEIAGNSVRWGEPRNSTHVVELLKAYCETRQALAARDRRLVFIASPLRGDVERNQSYARACMLDALSRGEAPFAPHLLYPQVLDPANAEQDAQAIHAALLWLEHAAGVLVVYRDLGVTEGMKTEIALAERLGITVVYRVLVTSWMIAGTQYAIADAMKAAIRKSGTAPVPEGGFLFPKYRQLRVEENYSEASNVKLRGASLHDDLLSCTRASEEELWEAYEQRYRCLGADHAQDANGIFELAMRTAAHRDWFRHHEGPVPTRLAEQYEQIARATIVPTEDLISLEAAEALRHIGLVVHRLVSDEHFLTEIGEAIWKLWDKDPTRKPKPDFVVRRGEGPSKEDARRLREWLLSPPGTSVPKVGERIEATIPSESPDADGTTFSRDAFANADIEGKPVYKYDEDGEPSPFGKRTKLGVAKHTEVSEVIKDGKFAGVSIGFSIEPEPIEASFAAYETPIEVLAAQLAHAIGGYDLAVDGAPTLDEVVSDAARLLCWQREELSELQSRFDGLLKTADLSNKSNSNIICSFALERDEAIDRLTKEFQIEHVEPVMLSLKQVVELVVSRFKSLQGEVERQVRAEAAKKTPKLRAKLVDVTQESDFSEFNEVTPTAEQIKAALGDARVEMPPRHGMSMVSPEQILKLNAVYRDSLRRRAEAVGIDTGEDLGSFEQHWVSREFFDDTVSALEKRLEEVNERNRKLAKDWMLSRTQEHLTAAQRWIEARLPGRTSQDVPPVVVSKPHEECVIVDDPRDAEGAVKHMMQRLAEERDELAKLEHEIRLMTEAAHNEETWAAVKRVTSERDDLAKESAYLTDEVAAAHEVFADFKALLNERVERMRGLDAYMKELDLDTDGMTVTEAVRHHLRILTNRVKLRDHEIAVDASTFDGILEMANAALTKRNRAPAHHAAAAVKLLAEALEDTVAQRDAFEDESGKLRALWEMAARESAEARAKDPNVLGVTDVETGRETQDYVNGLIEENIALRKEIGDVLLVMGEKTDEVLEDAVNRLKDRCWKQQSLAASYRDCLQELLGTEAEGEELEVLARGSNLKALRAAIREARTVLGAQEGEDVAAAARRAVGNDGRDAIYGVEGLVMMDDLFRKRLAELKIGGASHPRHAKLTQMVGDQPLLWHTPSPAQAFALHVGFLSKPVQPEHDRGAEQLLPRLEAKWMTLATSDPAGASVLHGAMREAIALIVDLQGRRVKMQEALDRSARHIAQLERERRAGHAEPPHVTWTQCDGDDTMHGTIEGCSDLFVEIEGLTWNDGFSPTGTMRERCQGEWRRSPRITLHDLHIEDRYEVAREYFGALLRSRARHILNNTGLDSNTENQHNASERPGAQSGDDHE